EGGRGEGAGRPETAVPADGDVAGGGRFRGGARQLVYGVQHGDHPLDGAEPAQRRVRGLQVVRPHPVLAGGGGQAGRGRVGRDGDLFSREPPASAWDHALPVRVIAGEYHDHRPMSWTRILPRGGFPCRTFGSWPPSSPWSSPACCRPQP